MMAWLFFGLSGRLSRVPYFLGFLFFNVVLAFVVYRIILVPEQSAEAQFWSSVFVFAGVVSMWWLTAMTIKRLHDINRPGLLALLLFVPVVSIAAFLYLCIVPGDAGPNQYGRVTNAPA
ncbi:MAG: DUF805 domain-containing protein [Mesorhizobium sp.]